MRTKKTKTDSFIHTDEEVDRGNPSPGQDIVFWHWDLLLIERFSVCPFDWIWSNDFLLNLTNFDQCVAGFKLFAFFCLNSESVYWNNFYFYSFRKCVTWEPEDSRKCTGMLIWNYFDFFFFFPKVNVTVQFYLFIFFWQSNKNVCSTIQVHISTTQSL